ncbi:MAG TPA: hypothetical protein VN924_21040, partial [Bryobacteraceae bacterium]|nr:hypothetical protein [Bryobacteraceae bacterium]
MFSVDEMTNQAGFVFDTQVEPLGASGAAGGFPVAAETAIVRVTKVFRSSGGVDNSIPVAISITPFFIRAGEPIEPIRPIEPIGPIEPIEPVKPVVPIEPV